jgi:ABC-type transport system involved in cytochrome bd biosynthesis fused ATPase/permease subunit
MNKVTITISGPTGVGKSTLAQLIGRSLLFFQGVEVDIVDEDGSDSMNWDDDELQSRIDGLAQRTQVLIVTQTTRRSSPNE